MTHEEAVFWLRITILSGVVLGIFLLCSEDGVEFGLIKKASCGSGRHWYRRNKYYCAACKAPRKHPQLRVVDGGKKDKIDAPGL